MCVLRPRCTLVLVSFQVICLWSASCEGLLGTLHSKYLAGFVRVLYTSLHVRAVMSVMSAKQPGIFPHACGSI